MHVSLSALEKELRLVDDLAETEDPADFGERALPGLGRLARAEGRRRAPQALTGPAGSPRAGLTGRELQILELVALGRTNRSIARTLQVSPRTVAKHLEHIYRKLDVSSRAAAVYRATDPSDPLTGPQ